MIIELDSSLKETIQPTQLAENLFRGYYFSESLGLDKNEKATLLRSPDLTGADDTQDGFFDMLSTAYSLHQNVTIAPHDIWIVVLNEIASLIEQNVDQCRPLFTRQTEGKIVIMIPTDDVTAIDLNLIHNRPRDLVPVDISTFVPELSTYTQSARYAAVAALSAGLKHYYEYMTFLCGIPAIKVTGTTQDWNTLWEKAEIFAEMFSSVGLESVGEWMTRVQRIIRRCGDAVEGNVNLTEWKNIYTHDNVGSGRDLKVTGWIKELYREPNKIMYTHNVPNSWSVVPYKNAESGREFIGLHGGFIRRRDDDGFVYTDYAEAVFEKTSTSEIKTNNGLKFEISKIESKQHKIDQKYTIEQNPDIVTMEPSDEALDELSAQLINSISNG